MFKKAALVVIAALAVYYAVVDSDTTKGTASAMNERHAKIQAI